MCTSHRMSLLAIVIFLLKPAAYVSAQEGGENEPPIADAGLTRYTAANYVQLDGTGSYDPDQSGPLSYTWIQVSGTPVNIAGADTATPKVGQFAQTDVIRECEFELVVSDGELTSLPDTVRVVIVPAFGENQLRLYNDAAFDPDKPTIVYFQGGDGIYGNVPPYIMPFSAHEWTAKANIIWLPDGYSPDSLSWPRYYYRYGDMLILYLSDVAPDYSQPIQTSGWNTGGQPAIDAAIRLNLTYADPRYAVNHVTFVEAAQYTRNFTTDISTYLGSSVEGEQCWMANFVSAWSNSTAFYDNVMNVAFETFYHPSATFLSDHTFVPNWYGASVSNPAAMQFNGGIVAGAYWSVIGPGKNLQLASSQDAQIYKFRWYGSTSSGPGYMDHVDELEYPGKLPEPVTLIGPLYVGEPNAVLLTCRESENAVGYEVLLGSDPYRVAEYRVVSDTPLPPMEAVGSLSPEDTWWTIRVRDQHGSTIHADPIPLDLTDLDRAPFGVENARSGKRYCLIGHAILEAEPGDTLWLDPGTYKENIEFTIALTVSSLAPDDPLTVAETIITGRDGEPTVTFCSPESVGSTLAGLTIQSGTLGISCSEAAPTVQGCVIDCPNAIAVEFWYGHGPQLMDCTIVGQTRVGGTSGLISYWMFDAVEGVLAYDSAGDKNGTVWGDAVWQPEAGRAGGALQFDGIDDYVQTDFVVDPGAGPFSVYAWIKGGSPGQAIVSQETAAGQTCVWLGTDSPSGALMTGLMVFPPFIPPLLSETIVTDDQWHEIGLVQDGKYRHLYVDGQEVAKDATAWPKLNCQGGLHIGAGSHLEDGTFWSGLIDDVRIFDRVLTPDEL